MDIGTKTAPATAPHFYDLDGIRGIMALTVMLDHYGLRTVLNQIMPGLVVRPPFPLIVDFFFVLSGFVLVRSYIKRPRPAWERLQDRLYRLLPVHVVLMLMLLPLAAVSIDGRPMFDLSSVGQVMKFIAELLAVNIYFSAEFVWNRPSWSINNQIYLPVILSLFLPFLGKVNARPLLALIVLFAILQAALAYMVGWEIGKFLLGRGVVGIILGGLLSIYASRGLLHVPQTSLVVPACLALFGVMILVGGWYPAITLIAPLLIVIMVIAGTRSRSYLGSMPMRWLGKISFSLYLVHMPIAIWAQALTGARSFSGDYGFKLLLILLCLAAAWLLTATVEKWGVQLGKWARTPRRVLEPAV